MSKLYSHTLVKNGKPFIKLVLKQVAPYVNQMFVTLSIKSEDGTRNVLAKLQSKYKGKLVVSTEKTESPADLTKERQKMLEKTPRGSWILFLDDDDYWSKEQLKLMRSIIAENKDVDGYSVNPYQVIDKKYHDDSWRYKFFLKWFKNKEGVHYEGNWPRDLIYKGNEVLYWRKNPRVPRIPIRFYHLSYIKNSSFRKESWAKEYSMTVGKMAPYPKIAMKELDKIFKYVK